MSKYKSLQNRLGQREILIMDGGMGTEILHRGVPTTLPLWSAEALITTVPLKRLKRRTGSPPQMEARPARCVSTAPL
jgi:hypothetical protein